MVGAVFGPDISVEWLLSWVFAPLAWLSGVEWADAREAGLLLGTKLTQTEFKAFIDLGAVPAEAISERTRMLMTYALCGFANIGSVGITVTGLSVLMPERREEVLGMVWKALFAGFLATLMTASVVGALPGRIFGTSKVSWRGPPVAVTVRRPIVTAAPPMCWPRTVTLVPTGPSAGAKPVTSIGCGARLAGTFSLSRGAGLRWR